MVSHGMEVELMAKLLRLMVAAAAVSLVSPLGAQDASKSPPPRVVTKTLVVMGDPQITTTPEHPRGAMLRAYDKKTGQQVGAVLMPAIQSGTPMTYMVDGKQYLMVAVSGGNYSGEYIAYSLPN